MSRGRRGRGVDKEEVERWSTASRRSFDASIRWSRAKGKGSWSSSGDSTLIDSAINSVASKMVCGRGEESAILLRDTDQARLTEQPGAHRRSSATSSVRMIPEYASASSGLVTRERT